MAKYRKAVLAEMQIGPLLQEMSTIAFRHGVPLPASMTLAAKALAQVQLATAHLDPKLDPYDVAGKFLMRVMIKRMGGRARSQSPRLSVTEVQSTSGTGGRGCRAPDRRSSRSKACREFQGRFDRGDGSTDGAAPCVGFCRCNKHLLQCAHGHVGNSCRLGTAHVRNRCRTADAWTGPRSHTEALMSSGSVGGL